MIIIVGKTKGVCTLDNPTTFQRELWKDGKLLATVAAEVLQHPHLRVSLEREYPGQPFYYFPWDRGRVEGDPFAVAIHHKEIQ